MKISRNIFLITVFAVISMHTQAQKVKLVSGNLNFLKNQRGMLLRFDYDTMAVGEYNNEQDYIVQKMASYNEKNPGSGEKWLQNWQYDRGSLFQPAFRKNLNALIKPLSMSPIYDSTQYTLIVKTVFTEPGFYVTFFARKRAVINVVYVFVETQNPNHVLATLKCNKIKTGYLPLSQRYDVANRLTSAYGYAGTLLGTFLSIEQKK
jgi:hypothetical protein